MKNNKGISIIELIATLAILSIISAGIAGLIAVSMRSYGKVSTDAQTQNEAQLAVNQLENLIIDCTNGIVYVDETSEDKTLLKHNGINYDRILYVYNASERYVVGWTKDTKQLTYYREARDAGSATGFSVEDEKKPSLMAEYVSDFSIDMSSTEENRKVAMGVKFDVAERFYSSNRSVTMRNKTLINGNPEDMYVDLLEVNTTYDGLSVTIDGERFMENGKVKYFKTWEPNDANPENGDLYVATLGVSVIGDGYPSQDVTWSIDDPTAAEIVGGRLHVKKASEFTLTAKAKGASEDAPLTLTVTILTHQITGIEAAFPTVDTKLVKGQTYQPKANVLGANVSGYDTYDWKIISGGTKNGKRFTVDDSDDLVIIEYTSTFDPSVNTTVCYEKQDIGGNLPEIDNTVRVELALDTPTTGTRGERLQFHLFKIQGLLKQEITRRIDVKWDCELSTAGTAAISRVGLLSIGKNIPKAEDAVITVTAEYKDENGKTYKVKSLVNVAKTTSGTGGNGDDDDEDDWEEPEAFDPTPQDPWVDDINGITLRVGEKKRNWTDFRLTVQNRTGRAAKCYRVVITYDRDVTWTGGWNVEWYNVQGNVVTVESKRWWDGDMIQAGEITNRIEGIQVGSDGEPIIQNVQLIWVY